jgi:hypothetical protein
VGRPAHHNSRVDGVPGGTNLLTMTPEQVVLRTLLEGRVKRDPRSIVFMLMRHMTSEEQLEAVRVYELRAVR